MLLKNTSRYDSGLVRHIIRHAANRIEIDDVAINIKNSPHWYAGRAYSRVPDISPWSRKCPRPQYLVVCRIGAPEKFPYQSKGYPRRKIENGCWPTPEFADWQEALVYLVAHELMHIQQFRFNTSCTEKETEAHGMRRLEAWRELVASGKVPVFSPPPERPAASRKPKENALAEKLAHAEKMLKRSNTRLKRTEASVDRWRKKVRHYQKQTERAILAADPIFGLSAACNNVLGQ